MPSKTTNYNLIKPLETENYDINVQNGNMDIIDGEIKKTNTLLSNMEEERGYVNSKVATDFNKCIQNGKYFLKGTALNKPTDYAFPEYTEFALDVTQTNRGIKQELTVAFIPEASMKNKKYVRCSLDGSWTTWNTIATIEQVKTMLEAYQLKTV